MSIETMSAQLVRVKAAIETAVAVTFRPFENDIQQHAEHVAVI
jgi:hypothetical protein